MISQQTYYDRGQVIEVRADVHNGPQGWHASGAGFDRTSRRVVFGVMSGKSHVEGVCNARDYKGVIFGRYLRYPLSLKKDPFVIPGWRFVASWPLVFFWLMKSTGNFGSQPWWAAGRGGFVARAEVFDAWRGLHPLARACAVGLPKAHGFYLKEAPKG